MRTGVEFGNTSFPLWDAAIAAGATLSELYLMDYSEAVPTGGFPQRFLAKVVAWHRLHQLIDLHSHDAAATAAEKEAKRRKK